MNPPIMSLLLGVSLALFTWSLIRRLLPLKAMQPEVRWDRPLRRLGRMAKFALGQRRFFSSFEAVHGAAHILIFWGFLVLGLNTVNLIGRGFVSDWSLPGLGESSLGLIYTFLKDLFVLAVLTGCLIALARRLVTRPERLILSLEAALILIWIGAMMILEVLYSGAYLLIHPDWPEGEASFLGRMGREVLVSSGVTRETTAAGVLLGLGFWGHVVMVLLFLNYLPHGKHFHVLTSLPGVFFAGLNPPGRLTKTDLTEPDTVFGVTRLQDYSWKRAWDMYTCTECGRCQALCPAHLSGKPLSPKRFMIDQREILKAEISAPSLPLLARVFRGGGKNGEETDPAGDPATGRLEISDEAVWACTTCGQCTEVCPLLIEHTDHLIDLRRGLVMVQGSQPKEAVAAFKAWENMSNPWSLAANSRGDLPKELGVPTPQENPGFEYLYYVGCAGSFDDRAKKSTAAFMGLLQKAGVDFVCLGNEEKCCGETARRLGNEYLAQMMITANVEQWTGLGVKKIITACPHCYNTIANEYPEFGGCFQVTHHSQFLNELVEQGKLPLDNSGYKGSRAVYHDPCYLGRYNGFFDPPRTLLTHGLGLDLVEPERTGNLSLCCGAGGGRMWMEEDREQRVNHLRSDQLLATGADIWATACPYCRIMLEDAVVEQKIERRIKVLDLTQLFNKTK